MTFQPASLKINVNELDENFISDFSQFWFNFKPYNYQTRFLNTCLRNKRVAAKWPRQSGKSHTVAVYSLFKALTSKLSIIIVAPTQTQSSELYNKVRDMITNNEFLMTEVTKSTETEMRFKNGSRIISLPSGPFGASIRGFTADIVILEESGIMKDSIVNSVITPMIAAKPNGQLIKIGTPLTKNHFYNSCFRDKNYQVINISWQECVKEGQYKQEFIDEQRENLLDIEFRTEYEAEFIEDLASFFPSSLLQGCMEEYPLFKDI